jgi:predicted RNase H-like nuclease (RuvC/YqgF family)
MGQHNHYEETATALANLATATAADRQVMANLTNTIETLTKQLASSQTEIQTLKHQLNQQRQQKPRTNYCWSHGFAVGVKHTSETCRMPKDGHQKAATRDNTMGGSTIGKPR